jgi:type I restriction enzyme S subunit
MEFKEYRFDEVTINFDKKRVPISGAQRKKRQGKYRYYGAQGIIDYIDDFIFDGTYLLIAEDGENLKSQKQKIAQVVDGQFWVNNHAHIVQGNELCDTRYLCYLLNSMDLSGYITGSAQPKLSQANLNSLILHLPSISEQRTIVEYLYMFDKKISVNQQINDNLQQQAAALFESWFVNLDPWNGVQPSDWENAPLGSFVEIKRGGSPRPIQDYLSDSGLRWLKISDVTSLNSPFVLEIKEHIKEDGLRKTVFLHAGELVLSNSATPGIPKILDVDTCIHDGWLYFPKSELSKYYLYLFFKHIRKELVALGNGSVFTNLKTDILKAFPATKADKSTLKEFDALVAPLFNAMLNADRENFKLAAMRDALLPKLMSGEVDVSAVDF